MLQASINSATPSSLGVRGVRPRQLLFGRQEVKFSSMTSGAVSQCQLLQSCPGRCPCQAGSGCRKATPRLWGWGSKVAMGGGHGDSDTARSFPGQSQGHPHTHSCSSFSQTQAYLPRPYPAPTPKLQQPPRTLVREVQAAALPTRGCWEWGSCMPPPTPSPFPITATSHPLCYPHLWPGQQAGKKGMLTCSGRQSADGDPRCSLLVPTCYILQVKEEGGNGVKKKKRGGLVGE